MLVIHRAERADVLVSVLAEMLREPATDPFAAEVVAVPTRGIERWLAQMLSAELGARPGGGDGVCANVSFPSPRSLLDAILATASGVKPETDPWQPSRLVWPLLRVVERSLEEAWIAPLTRHLRDGTDQRYARVAHIARLFDDYALHRPSLIRAWERGDSGGIDEEAPAGWQPELWRRLREEVASPSLAERLEPASAAIAADPELIDLPPRLAVFGLTRLPASHLTVLRALSSGRDVHLMVLHPSAVLWSRGHAQNRLLASWGRDVHGLQEMLAGADEDHHHPARSYRSPTAVSTDSGRSGPTLLATLQTDIHSDRRAPGAPLRPGGDDARLELQATDTSIRIHACHGRGRQVEVLREAILHRLAADPTLEPRDVIVMCPDIESFAPLIEATFGGRQMAPEDGDGPGQRPLPGEPPVLRVRLADRSLRRTTPILAAVARLLELAAGRVTASEVLDLADTEPVRARFGFDDEELTQIRGWVATAQIHWGLDGPSRAAYKLAEVEAGTWAAGLRRLLLGVAMDAQAGSLYQGVLASGQVPSSQIELAGRFAEFVDRLDAALGALSVRQTVPGWSGTLTAAADALTATPDSAGWQRRQLDAILAELVAAASSVAESEPPLLSLTELRALLGERLEGRPTRANFRSGQLTFCTLVPMRSVPHRLVCLLGLDDGSFPRQARRDGDNLLLADPQPGDRDPRTEDRQLLLDALLAAQEAMIITYSGHDERTNAPLPPAVPVGELLDAIDATARVQNPAPGEDADRQVAGLRPRDLIVVQHPLQPFDPRNFLAVGSEPARAAAGPWSFDSAALAGARALTAPRREPPPFLPEPLTPADGQDLVTLQELISFLQRPVQAFLRQRLGLSIRREEDEVDDALPLELDQLERWGIGQRLLDALLAGVPAREATLAEIARGTLPPGQLGRPVVAELWPDVEAIAAAVRSFSSGGDPRSEQTNVILPGGMRLTGTVGGVHGHVLLTAGYSRLGPRQRLSAWVRLLALTAANPEVPFEAITIGRGNEPGSVQVIRLPQLGSTGPVRAAAALAQLEPLVTLRARGLRHPLPAPCRTLNAYAEAIRHGEDPLAAALRRWRTGWYNDRLLEGEEAEPEHQLVFGGELDTSHLEELAALIWAPLLAREVIG